MLQVRMIEEEAGMKKHYFIHAIFVVFLWQISIHLLFAQELTYPFSSFGEVYVEYGTVTQDGVANPGPRGGYSSENRISASELFFAKGYRWWGYPGAPLFICGDLPEFNFPGYHGVWDMTGLGCMNPPIGYKGSWGGIMIDPVARQIYCLVGAINHNGPTAQYCIPNPFGSGQICYSIPSSWGYGSSYGYTRQAVVVQSTGELQNGDPVEIRASLQAEGGFEGDGTPLVKGVLFLTKLSVASWLQWGSDYLNWGAVEDILGTPGFLSNMLGHLVIDLNESDNASATVSIGDTIVVEVAFRNEIKQDNPGASGDAEGWIGTEPEKLYNINYVRTDSIMNLVLEHGNQLTYDLVPLTEGAILEPVSASGPNLDSDQDGISDAREMGPDGNDNTFDGNGDGTPDHEQANVTSFSTYDGQNYVTLVVSEGTDLADLKVTGNPSPDDAPEDAEFPYGFFDFTIEGLDPGEAIVIMLYIHNVGNIPGYYKYGLTPDDSTPHWYEFTYDGQTGAEFNGNVITLHFVDGLRGDEDITANGTIKEPGGPIEAISTGVDYAFSAYDFNLDQNQPNPFQTTTTIRYELAQTVWVKIIVYDLFGKEVKTLLNQQQPAGEYSICWTGTNNSGRRSAPGIYYYQMEVMTKDGIFRQMKKMILMQ